MQRIILLLTITLLSAPLLADEVYRWVDEKGIVHYTDRKPKQYSKRIKTIKAPASDAQAVASNDTEEATKASRCTEYKKLLSDYEGAQSLSRRDADGSERLLTVTERTQLLDDTRKQIEAFCQE